MEFPTRIPDGLFGGVYSESDHRGAPEHTGRAEVTDREMRVTVVNDQGQHALWPVPSEIPRGWRQVGPAGSPEECAARVDASWTDIRPNSPAGPDVRTVPELIADRAREMPDHPAVISEHGSLDYGELDRRADLLAARLRARAHAHGDGPGRGPGAQPLVTVCHDRSPNLMVALLAVLRAGAAFLPLDPGLPRQRLARLIEDSGSALVLTDSAHTWLAPHTLAVDGPEERTPTAVPGLPPPAPDDPAYLIYTSGSSGTPKGVMVSHRSLATVLAGLVEAYGLGPGDRVFQLAALGFDTSLEQLFAPLTAGATVVLADRRGCAPSELWGRLAAHRITVADLTPAYWHQYQNAIERDGLRPLGLRLMIVGGEAVAAEDCRRWFRLRPGVRLVNAYGLTETTITSTLCELSPAVLNGPEDAPVPIGHPVSGATVHLLDERLRPVPDGGTGELYIGGAGVAIGFWHQPGRTAELFLPDPFAATPGARMYRTGDLGRRRADGELEYLGRLDRQVKIRGYRVDPAELEAALAAHPAVDRAVAVPEDGALAAFYTTRAPVAEPELRAHLAERLPRYMLPPRLAELAELPLDHNGKLDRRGLLLSTPPLTATEPDRATPLGTGVAELWSRILQLEQVGPEDDFFVIGGDSLLATEMLARARIMFGIGVSQLRSLTRALLQEPTLAAFTRNTQAARAGTLTSGDRPTDFAAEAALGVPVRTTGGPPPDWRHPREVLLTGATGFCGIHLLDELLTTTDARVHCLLRGEDPQSALARLRAAGLRHLLRDPLNGPQAGRVVPVLGDLGQPLLGLTEREFGALGDSLDLVVNCGARVNFVYPYGELSAANVAGVRELVRLAGWSRGIPLHHVSSMSVLAGYGAAGVRQVTERTPLGFPEHLSVGYAETKWVAEELLRQAAEAGLPVTVHRLNDVTGAQDTGVMNPGTEMCALIRLFADAGCAPDVDLPLDFLPADCFARALVHLATHQEAVGQAYHLTTDPGHPLIGELAARLRAFGYPVEDLPYRDWVSRYAEYAAGHPTHPATPFLPLFVDRCAGRPELTVSEMYFRRTFPRFGREQLVAGLAGSGIVFPPVDSALLDRYLKHLIGTGYLAPPTVPTAG
ncbi:amino acid adenylation domain-containing protein [Kitasatospora sp. NPDC051853]|uniref:amino acid adenylation domain-containing protein n=1 Tax=Kitasatospora sp. NPDC051853 TaxID=3364058 RepID=UPI0037A3A878